MSNFADRLNDAVARRRMPGVVNLDPVYEKLPAVLRQDAEAGGPADAAPALRAIERFGQGVIEAIAPHVPAVKINSAYFEVYRGAGLDAYFRLVGLARQAGLVVIGDVKRGDVGHTADQYAEAHVARPRRAGLNDADVPDAITINGYFGADGVRPFTTAALAAGRGVFVLVRTSNESAATVQDLTTDGGRKVHDRVAGLVAAWAEDPASIGSSGDSSIGAVVATRDPADAARLRAAMPRSIFLVPGYGAQGGTADELRPYFKPGGRGAIIAAGRSVIFAHEDAAHRGRLGDDWRACVGAACAAFRADIQRAAYRA